MITDDMDYSGDSVCKSHPIVFHCMASTNQLYFPLSYNIFILNGANLV